MAERRVTSGTALAIALVATAMLLVARATSDFWMDELLTITLFAQRPALSEVFSNYPIANNHVLYSAVAWCWLKIAGPLALGNELVMRLPSIAATLGAVVVVAIGARSTLGADRAALAGLMLGISPAVQSLGWQVRGYGLTICLASLAAVGLLHAATNLRLSRAAGLLLLLPLVLLPVVVPSNLVYTLAIALTVTVVWWRRERPREGLPLVAASAVASVAGMLVYLPIGDQFLQVVRQTAGWDSGIAVCGNFLLATAILALPAAAIVVFARRLGGEQEHNRATATAITLAAVTTAACLAFALAKAPFPRTLVAFVPPIALAAAAILPSFGPEKLLKPLLIILGLGTFGSFCTLQLNDANRRNGVRSQNLITQFYTGSNVWSTGISQLAKTDVPAQRPIIIVPFHDVFTAQWYWPDQAGAQWINTAHTTGVYAFPLPITTLAERPFLILSGHGEDLVPDCEKLAQAPLQTESLGSSGALVIIKAQAKPAESDFSPKRP